MESDRDPKDKEDEDVNVAESTLTVLDLCNCVPAAIQHARCALHPLQLAVLDGIKNAKAAGVIGKIRNVAKETRAPKLHEIILKRTRKTAAG